MTDIATPFDALKSYPGLIHRQPVFVNNMVDLDRYHLRFLDWQGNLLADDANVPAFLTQLPRILPDMNLRQKALLTMPQSWCQSLYDMELNGMELTLDIANASPTSTFAPNLAYAGHAESKTSPMRTRMLLIDLNQVDNAVMTDNLASWRQQYEQLCALNVNDENQLNQCKIHHIDLVQGNFYTRPAAHPPYKISPDAQTLMSLLVKLQDTDAEADDLAQIISQDVTLSYKLLRLINSAFFGLPRQLTSCREAVVMLGFNQIKTWASLLCLSGLDHKPNELRSLAMTRARMCELLARYYKGQSDSFFAAGLFSTLDALLDKPMIDVVQDLPLAPELETALLNHDGPIGRALLDVLNYEQGRWQAVAQSPLPIECLARAYLDAIYWTRQLNQIINE
ncbi:putative signal transduction protein [Methylophaga frappieri]|uniref:Putative signal transduction protein n=1 Tax=Methylophaga frappieri (strain ATCC BAA-2434 / DSM 25690 / JAM7) TaxID=754477 RepID=I1YFV4_METFJ|nr:HDOD domain-containing protein [Methylophaga frappieri]AFJ01797.1 putative signal transduction protein [Methylophaga frappieri]